MAKIKEREPIISPLNTIEFETHITNFVEMSVGMSDYIDGYIFSRPNNMPMKGLFLEYEIKEGLGAGYHDTEVMVEKNGKVLPGKHSFVFQDVDEEGRRVQKEGPKNGILFIPLEISDDDELRIRMVLSEYAEPDFITKLDEQDLNLALEDFKSYYYVAFASEEPQILIGDLSGKRPTGGNVSVIYNNTNFFSQTPIIKVVRDGDKDYEDKYLLADRREISLVLREPGTYHITACVTDCAREKYNENNPERGLIAKVEKDIIVYEPCDIKIENQKVIKKGEPINIAIKANLPCEARRGYVSIKKYEEELSLNLQRDEKIKDRGVYATEIEFSSERLPYGLHVIIARFVLEDRTSETKTSTFLLADEGDWDLDYFD